MWEYRARPDFRMNKDDGDTVHLLIDVGFNASVRESLRLSGVRAPERTQPGGAETAAYRQSIMEAVATRAEHAGMAWPFRVVTEPNTNPEPDERMSFVRFIAIIYDMVNGVCINEQIKAFLSAHPEWGPGL